MTRGSMLWRWACRLGIACPHKWRPATSTTMPFRVCSLCDRSESMTDADFYAEFPAQYASMMAARRVVAKAYRAIARELETDQRRALIEALR